MTVITNTYLKLRAEFGGAPSNMVPVTTRPNKQMFMLVYGLQPFQQPVETKCNEL